MSSVETPRPPSGSDALQVTLRVGDRPLETRAWSGEGQLLPETEAPLRASRRGRRWVVEGPEGRVEVEPGAPVSVRTGSLEVQLEPVARRRFSRFSFAQGDAVLPVLVCVVGVLFYQLMLLFSLLFPEEGGGNAGFEPSPELIARLLDGDLDGAERGVLAQPVARPKTGDAIEGYYLQPGHDGPRDHQGGGKNVGDRVRDGKVDGKNRKRQEEAAAAGSAEAPTAQEPTPEPDIVAAAEGGADEEGDDEPIAVHVTEGWGLSDWYDTVDAREDAEEIRQNLELARQVLRIDPDNPSGLIIRAYYEYLAFDWNAAERTYQHFTKLYPEDPAGWNNLALVYKRKGDFQEEEKLYNIALGLDPQDDHALMNLALCLAHQGRFDEALQIMDQLEVLIPGDPYADLHRAKIYAAMGKEDRAYRFLQKSLQGMRKLDTLHNIEFRQDIRVDPAFATLREQERFKALLDRYYGTKGGGWWRKLTGK